MVKILLFAGSTRKESFNKKLIGNAVACANAAGADVEYIDLKDYPIPLYDGDLEDSEGIPENAQKIKELMKKSDAFIIASPEYNSGMSGVLKNMIDWVSRPEADEPPLVAFNGKYAVIMSTSPGNLGGLRGLYHLKYVLENIKITVLSDQITVNKSHEAFDENGTLKDDKKINQMKKVIEKLINLLK